MGGLTGFSSLAEGYMRLDDSGIGAPSEEFLNQPIGATDHPFLRMHAPTLNQLEAGRGNQMGALTDKMANFQLTGTDADMDYYEMRYQQRLKEEKMRARKAVPSSRPVKKSLPPSAASSSSVPKRGPARGKSSSSRGKATSQSGTR